MRQLTESVRLSTKGSRDTRGFNAAELVIMTVIVVIVGAAATPLINRVIAKNRLEGAASRVAGDLRYTQALAVSRGNMFRLVTATCAPQSGQTRYIIERNTDGGVGVAWAVITDAAITNTTTATQCYRLSSEFAGATLASITGSPSAPAVTEIRFNSRGTCTNCTGGGVTPPLRVTVSSPFGQRIVEVRTTGSVDIQ